MSPVVISLTCLGEEGRPMQCRLPPAGGQDKPSLSAWPSPVVPQGQHVTLQCRSHHKFDTFRMYKDNGILVSKLHSVMSQKGFLIGPVTPTQAGTYRCCGPCPGSSSVWSAPSNPRHLHVLAGPLVAIVFLAVLLFVLTRQWCPAKESESPEEDPQAEDPQEVIDTQSDHCISTWKKTTPTFQRPEESLRDDSVYVELATC
uniref:Killer cell immunoglobulin-like receptor 3DL3 n=1 Tax=Ailuropoda melanoleuca TaxID=9646 RepID=A0A7N5JBX1_AILME